MSGQARVGVAQTARLLLNLGFQPAVHVFQRPPGRRGIFIRRAQVGLLSLHVRQVVGGAHQRRAPRQIGYHWPQRQVHRELAAVVPTPGNLARPAGGIHAVQAQPRRQRQHALSKQDSRRLAPQRIRVIAGGRQQSRVHQLQPAQAVTNKGRVRGAVDQPGILPQFQLAGQHPLPRHQQQRQQRRHPHAHAIRRGGRAQIEQRIPGQHQGGRHRQQCLQICPQALPALGIQARAAQQLRPLHQRGQPQQHKGQQPAQPDGAARPELGLQRQVSHGLVGQQ